MCNCKIKDKDNLMKNRAYAMQCCETIGPWAFIKLAQTHACIYYCNFKTEFAFKCHKWICSSIFIKKNSFSNQWTKSNMFYDLGSLKIWSNERRPWMQIKPKRSLKRAIQGHDLAHWQACPKVQGVTNKILNAPLLYY